MKQRIGGSLFLAAGVPITLLLLRSSYPQLDEEAKAFLQRISPYQSPIKVWAYHWSLHHNLTRALIWKESSGDPDTVGSDGERGLCQIKHPTAQQMGFTGSADELFDPNINVHYATKYLRWQLNRYDQDLQKALSAYNAGTYIPENQEYVDRVLGYYRRLEPYN